MPGESARDAAAVVNGELDLAHLVELPGRGLGADMIGRMAAILVDLPMDTGTWGYRLAPRGSRLMRRAADLLREDLDMVEELWETAGFVGSGRPFKIQVAGPFTMAASVELAGGHKVLRDRGAVRDLVDSGAEGLRNHADEVSRRLGAQVVVQIDEPLVGDVIDGRIKPLTRFDVIEPVAVTEVAEALGAMIEQVGRPAILHNCGRTRWDLVRRLPGVALSADLTAPTATDLDEIGALIDRGDVLVAGVVPTTGDRRVHADAVATGLATLTDRIGLNRKVLRDNVIVTPTCGLAGASAQWATTALKISAKAGQLLAGDPTAL